MKAVVLGRYVACFKGTTRVGQPWTVYPGVYINGKKFTENVTGAPMEPPPRNAFHPGTFGSTRESSIPFPRLDALYSPSGIQSAKLNSYIIRILNTHLGANRITLRTWCSQHRLSYRRWGKLVNGESWLSLVDIVTLITLDERLRNPIKAAISATEPMPGDTR